MMDLDTDKGLSAKGHEKQDIVNQLRKDEKRGMLISNTSQSCGKIKDAQQGFDESNDASELKTFDVQEEMLYHSVVELFPDGIFVLDLEGIIQSCNATAVTLLGYSKEEIIGQKFSDIGKFDKKGIATYLNIFDSIIQGNIIDPFELKLQKKDKTLFTAEMRVGLLTQNGKKMGIQVITRKISDKKIQEEKNKESKDSVQRIFSHIPDMISVHDLEMNIIYSNWKGFAAIPEEKRILNTKCYKTYRGLDHICPDCKARTVLNTKESIQEEVELPEGIWVDLRVLPLIDENNEVEFIVEWVRDITESKQTEQVLRKSEKENRSIVEVVPDIIFRINKNGEYIDVKTSSEYELAKPKEDLLKKNIKDVFTSDVSSLILDTIRKAIATREIQVVEYELAVPAGKKSFEGRILRHNEDEVIAFVRDITKRKQMELVLLESEKKHRRLFETMAQGVIYQDADGMIISANPAAERILGLTFDQMQGKTSMDPRWQMIKEDCTAVPGCSQPAMVALRTGQTIGPVTRGIYRPDLGSHIWLRITAIPLFQPGETKPFQAYAVFEDITEQKENKKRLEQIQWMLSEKEVKKENVAREYGNLTELNKNGLILSSVGKKQLMQMTSEYLDLLETSSAVYEKNGDYAMGLFSSSWCQMMDAASRKLCRTDNNKEALSCGKWLCHESCWRASMKAIESGSPVDVKCNGGIHLYAVPILANGEVIGAINFGHGNPPDDDSELQKLSDLYQIPIEKIRKARQEYQVRPQFIIDHAKKRIQVSAKHIGSLVERKQAEEKLRESESQVRDLVNNTPDFIYSLNRERRHTAVNRSVCTAMDIEAHEIIGKTHSELGFPEDICREWHKLHDKVFFTKQVVKTETFTPMPDGTEHTYEVVLTPIFDENEHVTGIRGISRDITEIKQAAESLKQSEKKYRTYIDHAPHGVFICDEKGRYLEVNDKASEITGYSKDELLRMSIADITADEGKETAMSHFITLKERNYSSGELLFTHRNGSKHWWSVDAVKLSDNRFLCFMADITEKKRTEEKLHEREEHFRLLVDYSYDLIWTLKSDGVFSYVSPSWKAILGYEPSYMVNKEFQPFVHPDDICKCETYMKRVLDAEKALPGPQYRVKHVEGSWRWHEATITPVYANDGSFMYFVGVSRDITERKQAEEALKESKALLDATGFMARVGGWQLDAETMTVTWTKETYRIHEVPLNYKPPLDKAIEFFHPDDRDALSQAIQRALDRGEPYDMELKFITAKGNNLWTRTKCQPEVAGGKTVRLHGTFQDITERKQAEENLKQMHREVQELNKSLEKKVVQRTERIKQLLEQKDEFINQLGHDLKNPLGPFIQLLPILENHISDEKDKRMIKVLSRNAKYMRNLVKKTLDLAQLNSSKITFTFKDVSLSDIVDEVVEVNASLFDEYDVVVENHVSSDSLVHVDPLHIEEVFTNLFNNAVKYSEDKKWIGIDAVEKDDHVLVSVHDKGIGISEEQLPYLFDEYYKADSSRHDFDSSGLGLSISKRIIEKHGGRIWTESPGLGKGSTFYFTLPKKVD